MEQNPPVEHTSFVPSLVHEVPVATQLPLTPLVSQHPEVHWSPGQHASPGPPHAVHVVPLQTELPPLHCSPE